MPKSPPSTVEATALSTSELRPSLQVSLCLVARSLEFYMVLVPFSVYVGLFNAYASLLNQILTPYGMSDEEAGVGGAILVAAGLVAAAISSPILDRTKTFLGALKLFIPIIASCYLTFIWMPEAGSMAGSYVVLGIQGAASFILVPVALEFLTEVSSPVSPAVTSVLAWAGGQLVGGCLILVSNALQANTTADPPLNMKHALVFQAVLAVVVMPIPLCLGLFGRADKIQLRRR